MRITFLVKFLLLFVGVLLTGLGLAFYYLYDQAVSTAEDKFSVDFREGRDAALNLMKLRVETLRDKVRIISKAPQIRPMLETADADYATLQFSFQDFKESLVSDILIVANEKGLVKYWADRPAASGRPIGEWPVVADAMSAKSSWGVQVIDDGLFILAAIPVYSVEEGSLGAILLAGQQIDDAAAEEIRRISSMDVAFIHSGRLLASTFLNRDRQSLENAIRSSVQAFSETVIQDISMRGEAYRCAFTTLQGAPNAGILFLSSKDRVLNESLSPIKNAIMLAGFVGLIASFGVSYMIAWRMTQPIRALVEGTKAVEAGNYKHRVSVVQMARDELGDFAQSFNEMIKELEEKEKMQSVLNMGLGKEIAAAMLRRGTLGGEERLVTMMFSDLRGFTSLSEKMSPRQLVDLLNEYMTRMSACIEEEGGVVDKYVGDEIMSLFGAPVGHPDNTERAVRAAIKQRKALKALNEERVKRGEEEIQMGVGINSGRVIAGNMGSENRQNYTVIGAACNLASRLCSAATAQQILISEKTYEEIKDIFPAQKLDPIRVKNISEQVQVYEIL